jgi:ABC-type transport system substrate-binding protein
MLRPGFPGGGDEQWQPTYDPERAKQLLAESTSGSADAVGKITIIISEQGGAIFRLSIGASVQDPFYISNVAKTGASANITGYSDPEMDSLIDQADAEIDEAARLDLYAQIDKKISEEAIFLAPFRGTSTWFFKPNVRGMVVVQGRPWQSIHKMYIAEG